MSKNQNEMKFWGYWNFLLKKKGNLYAPRDMNFLLVNLRIKTQTVQNCFHPKFNSTLPPIQIQTEFFHIEFHILNYMLVHMRLEFSIIGFVKIKNL